MDFWQRMRVALDRGIEASKGVLNKAKDTAKELGERGALKIEIKELEAQSKNTLAELGFEVMKMILEEGKASVSAKNPRVKELIEVVQDTNQKVLDREKALQELEEKKPDKLSDPGKD